MILTSMTYKEMYDHLAADLPKIQFKMNMLFSKAVKIFRKTVRFPAWQLYDYKIPQPIINMLFSFMLKREPM